MDLTKPIDITAVNNTAKTYDKDIRTLDKLDAMKILQYFKMRPGVRGSVEITEAQHTDEGSGRYTGTFKSDRKSGTLVPRTLAVYPCVHEVADEPERYRTMWLSEVVSGKLDPNTHPFERWLIEFEIRNASENLYNVLATADYSTQSGNVALSYAFNGFLTILRDEVAANKITTALGNLHQLTAALSASNIGDQLLAMYRSAPQTLKERESIMFMSVTFGEMYDDWYKANHDAPPAVDTSGQTVLEGTNGKCKIVRLSCMPDTDDEIILTVPGNGVWGTDNPADMKNLVAFPSGNPYLFTAAMKYLFGFQWESIHKRKLILSKKFAG